MQQRRGTAWRPARGRWRGSGCGRQCGGNRGGSGSAPDFVFNSASCSVRNARISSVMARRSAHDPSARSCPRPDLRSRRRVCHDRGLARTGGPGRDPRRTDGRCPAPRPLGSSASDEPRWPRLAWLAEAPPWRRLVRRDPRPPRYQSGAPRGGVGACVRRRGGWPRRRDRATWADCGPRGERVSSAPGSAVCPAPSRPTARAARPYAVVRRTRRRGGTVRGAAVRVGWGRPPRGVACACCAR